VHQPSRTAFLNDIGALLNTPAVENHHRHDIATVRRPPPAGGPVAATLLLECAVAQEHGETFSGQWHVNVLNLSKTEVTAFGYAPGRMDVDMASERNAGQAFGRDGVRVEVLHQLGQPFISGGIPPFLARRDVADKNVDRVNGRNAMALPHEPAAG